MFKLNIESTRDITELRINFSDGTSCVAHSDKAKPDVAPVHNKKTQSKKKQPSSAPVPAKLARDGLIDTDIDFNDIPQEVIEKPDVSRGLKDRPARVADELQNFDI